MPDTVRYENRVHQMHSFPEGSPPFIYHYDYFDSRYVPHFPNIHRNPEFLLCKYGSGYVFYNSEIIPFRVGDMILCNSDVIHRIVTDTRIEYHCMILDDRFMGRIGLSVDEIMLVPCCHDEKANALYENCVSAFIGEDRFRTPHTVSALCEMMTYLIENYTDKTAFDMRESKIHAKMRTAIRFILSNYNRALSVEEIAANVFLSVSHYSREFKNYTGMTTVEYLNRVRCREANALLLQNVRVNEAAALCGFDNKSYFSKVYKDYLGESPSETLAKAYKKGDGESLYPASSKLYSDFLHEKPESKHN